MNVYAKLQKVRVELQNLNLKKSGQNKFAGFKYYDLSDILPSINVLMDKHGLCSQICYLENIATLTIINSEKPEEQVVFTSPMAELELKAANSVQNLGGQITYLKRYLYMNAMEIVEHDELDATLGSKTDITKQMINKIYKLAKDRGFTPLDVEKVATKTFSKNVIQLNNEEYDYVYHKLETKPVVQVDSSSINV